MQDRWFGRLARSALATGILCAAVNAPAGARESDEVRAQFREAYFAASTGAELTAENDDPELRAYPLYAYLEAARIGKALSLVEDPALAADWDDEAEAFLERHAGEPVADGLMLAWLESLARRGRRDELIERYRPDIATAQLQCQWLAARLEAGRRDGLVAAALERWLTPAQLPIECEPVFEWLREEGVLDADWTERRLRLLLENGQAGFGRVIARQLPEARRQTWFTWADLIETPDTAIDALIAEPEREAEFDWLLDAFQRLATANPDAAIARLERLVAARSLDRRQSSLLRRAVAYGLAWDRDSRALEYFARVDAEETDDYTLQWRVRSALWVGDWQLVADSIDALSAASRAEVAWRYWEARAAAELGDSDRSTAGYESILASDNFYAVLAAARLGRDFTPNPARFESDRDLVRAIGELAAMIRARELRAVNLPAEALTEWRFATSMLNPEARRQSIHVAFDWGWYDVAIATATNEQIFFDYNLLYPQPFDSEVNRAARVTRLDGPLIYGVIRQESLFRADAASGAGALGLMQLLPETARLTAASWERDRPDRDALFEPETNIVLGAAHLRDLVERFDGQLVPALAAYNAGPLNVDAWLPGDAIDIDIWIENIPYNETRTYVRRVLWHSLVFKWLDERRPQDAADWTGRIAS